MALRESCVHSDGFQNVNASPGALLVWVSSAAFHSAVASCWALCQPSCQRSEPGSGPGDCWYSYKGLAGFPLRNGLFSGVVGWGLPGCGYFCPSCVPSFSQSSCSPGNLHLAHPQAFVGSRLLRPQRGPVGFSTFSGIGSQGWDLMGVLFCCVLFCCQVQRQGPPKASGQKPRGPWSLHGLVAGSLNSLPIRGYSVVCVAMYCSHYAPWSWEGRAHTTAWERGLDVPALLWKIRERMVTSGSDFCPSTPGLLQQRGPVGRTSE